MANIPELVIHLRAAGMPFATIAERLDITEDSARGYAEAIAHCRPQAIAHCAQSSARMCPQCKRLICDPIWSATICECELEIA